MNAYIINLYTQGYGFLVENDKDHRSKVAFEYTNELQKNINIMIYNMI